MKKRVLCLVSFILIIMLGIYQNLQVYNATNVVYAKSYSSCEFIKGDILDIANQFSCTGFSFETNSLSFLEKLDAKVVHSSNVCGIENIYYYSTIIAKYEMVGNSRVNIHIAKSSKGIQVGVPLIYYGY